MAIAPPPAAQLLAAPAASPHDLPAYLLAFGSALLGGLIPNLMPFVFPIPSLKAMPPASSGRSSAHLRSAAPGVLVWVGGGGVPLAALLLVQYLNVSQRQLARLNTDGWDPSFGAD